MELLTLVCGGGAGAALMQLYTLKASRKRAEADARRTEAEAEKQKFGVHKDAFDTLYSQLTHCLEDYSRIADDYRNFREKYRKYEEEMQQRIREKCEELAGMKSQIQYLKGLRCYNMTCQDRIKVNPDKTAQPEN